MLNYIKSQSCIWLIAVALICCPQLLYAQTQPAANDLLTQINAQFKQYPTLHAEFIQTKQMAALKRPLIISGKLVYARDKGLLWQIEQPYKVGYVLTELGIVEIGADGTRKTRGPREVPGLAQIGNVFRAVLSADTAVLRQYFDVSAHGDINNWQLSLQPRAGNLAQFMTGLELNGGRFVETIKVSEASGDATQMRFRNSRTAADLSEQELQLFGKP